MRPMLTRALPDPGEGGLAMAVQSPSGAGAFA